MEISNRKIENFMEENNFSCTYAEKEGKLAILSDRIQWLPIKGQNVLVIPFSQVNFNGILKN